MGRNALAGNKTPPLSLPLSLFPRARRISAEPFEEILVYLLLKQRLKRPQVYFRVRLNEQEKALGVRQRVGTTNVKMNKNPTEGLMRILTERKQEILKELQDKFRDVRAEAESKETSEELGTGGIFEANAQQDLEFALIQMKANTLDQINQALSRLDEGAYGYCLECGEEIPERRLRALPFAIRCKDCEEALEVAEEERVRDRLLMVGSHVEG